MSSSQYDLDTSTYENNGHSNYDDDYGFDSDTRQIHVADWEPIYRDLDFLRFISELGPEFKQNDKKTIEAMVREGASLEGVDYDAFPHHAELDAMYDGAGYLTSQTPLIWTILANNESAATFLLSMGADANNPNESGQVPLEVAIENENPEMVDLLIAAGGKLDKPMEEIRVLEKRISNRDPNASQLSKITNSLYGMIFTRVEQRGGYYF